MRRWKKAYCKDIISVYTLINEEVVLFTLSALSSFVFEWRLKNIIYRLPSQSINIVYVRVEDYEHVSHVMCVCVCVCVSVQYLKSVESNEPNSMENCWAGQVGYEYLDHG